MNNNERQRQRQRQRPNNTVKMKKGRYNSLIISFLDQNFNQILALDPNVLITVIITIP